MALSVGKGADGWVRGALTAADAEATRPAIYAAAMLLILVAMGYPFFWTGNEDHYFVLARQWFDPTFRQPFDAAFDAASGKIVGLFVFGGAVDLFGWNAGRLLIGLLSAMSLAWGFATLAKALKLSPLDMFVVFLLFLACGQSVLGGEWFIGGIETKTFAYGLGMAGLAAMLTGRPVVAAIWVALALYFHFLVGAFWAGSVLIAALVDRRIRDVVVAGVGIAVLCAPLVFILVADQLRGAAVVAPPSVPDADYIYSIIRNPHHVAPFANPGWQRGVLTALIWAAAFGALCRYLAVRGDGAVKALGTTVAVLCLCVPVALVVSWIDRNTGTLGKLYLLRPFAPILLLGLFVVVAAWRKASREVPDVRLLPALLTVGVLMVSIGLGSFRLVVHRPPELQGTLVAALQRHVPAEAPVLLDPETDTITGIPRLSRRQTVVSWKMVPTDTADIYRWWQLHKFREAVFAGQCPEKGSFVRFVLAGEATYPRVARCGRVVWQGGGYRLLAVTSVG